MEGHDIIYNLCDRNWKEVSLEDYAADGFIVQLGSYTCANYFIQLVEWMADREMENFDFVIPVIPEHRLDILESKKFIECCKRCRQVVVNDFGMLQFLDGKYDLRMGRLFFKDYRDHRYGEYDSSLYYGKANTVLDFAARCGFRIVAYENDIITENYNLFGDKSIERYFHYPYRQISMSHICEYASIGKRIEDKYIPDDSCHMQCFGLHMASIEYGYLKIGKGIYDVLDGQYLRGIEGDYHLIMTPGK